ncbi:hypothetical protein [Asticcacaulis sp. YBE204]|uniref:hypothetical protein n=1 Tax=Asticcacaulis sp. YBE204 TaxID=1282363 RepID=UPI0003C3DEEA|nr:hypothetical protein [Asticcacaulis sp. YBE204]ESQ80267.1 hypothetical protein AEYBE204_06500 [Asticcacaulis sp. YBE204]
MSDYQSSHTAPGQPIKGARNAAEWSGLILSGLATAGFGIYVVYLFAGMFGG